MFKLGGENDKGQNFNLKTNILQWGMIESITVFYRLYEYYQIITFKLTLFYFSYTYIKLGTIDLVILFIKY